MRFVICFFIVTFQIFGANWTEPTKLSLSDFSATSPSISSISEKIFVVWIDDRLGDRNLFFRQSIDGGQTWLREEQISNHVSIQPSITSDPKSIYLTFVRDDQIFFTKSDDGKNWTKPIAISKISATDPKIAVTQTFPKNVIAVVWTRDETVEIAFSHDRGQTWTTPKILANSATQPDLVAEGRNFVVVWQDRREATSQIYAQKFIETRSFSFPFRLSQRGNARRPTISTFGDRIVVAYESRINSISPVDLFAIESDDFGESWSENRNITDNAAESILPQIAILSDRIIFFWQDGRNGNWSIFSRNSTEIEPQILSDHNHDAILPRVAVSDDQIHLVWVENEKIFYARRDTIPPPQPNRPIHLDSDGFDNDPQLTFFWEENHKSETINYHIFASIDGGEFREIGSTDKTIFTFENQDQKNYVVAIQSSDSVGNRSIFSEPSKPIFVDKTPPNVAIHFPLPNSILSKTFPIIATSTDSNLIETRIEFRSTLGDWEDLTPPIRLPFERERFIWNSENLHGIYDLRLTAVDQIGNRSTTKIKIQIDNSPSLPIVGDELVPLISDQNETADRFTFLFPSWSPDGRRIAFSSNQSGSTDIWIFEIESQKSRRITRNAEIEMRPTWNSRGDQIAFQILRGGVWEIATIREDGSDLKKLIENAEYPTWSRDGEKIAFASKMDGDFEIFVANSDGQNVRQITRNRSDDLAPNWHPNGLQIAYQSDRTGNWEIWQTDVETLENTPIFQSFANERSPKWSRDGKRLIAITDRLGRFDSLIEIVEKEITQISDSEISIQSAEWSPDDREIVVQAADQLYILPITSPIDLLSVKISEPQNGEILNGKIGLIGLARGKTFDHYRIDFFPIDQKSKSQRIGGKRTQPVEQIGFLGQWDARKLHGIYTLRLTVIGVDGEIAIDEVSVSVRSEPPPLEIFSPSDQLITTEKIISIRGKTHHLGFLKINGTPIELEYDGGFEIDFPLIREISQITITAERNGMIRKIERKVIRDTTAPILKISEPSDFAVVDHPFVRVRGEIDDAKTLFRLNGLDLPLTENGKFDRILRIALGTNEITFSAIDQFGRETNESRRVIFRRNKSVDKDLNPPAITDLAPANGKILTETTIELSAYFVDDTAIDPNSLIFELDDKKFIFDLDAENRTEFDGEIFEIDHETGKFIFRSPHEQIDGEHQIKIKISDLAGNTTETISKFEIDTRPFYATLSAERHGDWLTIFLTSNKRVPSINAVKLETIHFGDRSARNSYTIDLDQFDQTENVHKKEISIPFYFGDFAINRSHQSFRISAEITQPNGEIAKLNGYFSDQSIVSEIPILPLPQQIRGEPTLLQTKNFSIPHGPKVQMYLNTFGFDRSTADQNYVLRSQNGTDQNRVISQISDAKNRDLQIVFPITEFHSESELQIAFPIGDPRSDQNVALFRWDDRLNRWDALDAIRNEIGYISAWSDQGGDFALLIDREPPTIRMIENSAVVKMEILDRGSGVSTDRVSLRIDGRNVETIRNPISKFGGETGLTLIYLPSDLDPGRHTLKLIAEDRAGNVAEFESIFFSRDEFKFLRSVIAYPNPASDQITFDFRLTRSADCVIEIYDIAGNLIYSDQLNETSGHRINFVWTLENSRGERVADGIYLFLIEAKLGDNAIRRSGKFIVFSR